MSNRIIGFGDSFTYGLVKTGRKRLQVTSFGEYLAKKLKLKFVNKGICGAGNPTIANEIYNTEFEHGDFALVAWSGINRHGGWNQKTKRVDWRIQTPFRESLYMGEVSVRFAQNFLEDYNIPFLMISAFQDYKIMSLTKFNRFNDNWIEPEKYNNTLFDIIAGRWLSPEIFSYEETTSHVEFNIKNEYIAPCKHPSEKGHELIAKTLYPYVFKKMINI